MKTKDRTVNFIPQDLPLIYNVRREYVIQIKFIVDRVAELNLDCLLLISPTIIVEECYYRVCSLSSVLCIGITAY